jgi:RNA-binding protein YhbY
MPSSLSGKERGQLKSLLKTRPVDLKVGKKGLTPNLLSEIRCLLENEPLIKLRLAAEKPNRLEQIKKLEEEFSISLLAMVGKTASFSKLES